ncbi:hypothetical protein [Lewinella sp. LCG006]|uniref:hypothetical protein n=1 Tax=Lewinella sp. LCG006 TaxID=3231911 RepID=UPI00345F934F
MTSINVLNPQARIWVYQANEPFTREEVGEVELNLQQFAQQWVSHNRQLKAGAAVLHDRFLVLAVDESQAGASGCSIDSSVNFLKKLGAHYQRDLFDRLRFSYVKEGEVHTVSKDDFARLYQEGIINDETLVFDPLVKTVGELSVGFEKPLKNSWHARFV